MRSLNLLFQEYYKNKNWKNSLDRINIRRIYMEIVKDVESFFNKKASSMILNDIKDDFHKWLRTTNNSED